MVLLQVILLFRMTLSLKNAVFIFFIFILDFDLTLYVSDILPVLK